MQTAKDLLRAAVVLALMTGCGSGDHDPGPEPFEPRAPDVGSAGTGGSSGTGEIAGSPGDTTNGGSGGPTSLAGMGGLGGIGGLQDVKPLAGMGGINVGGAPSAAGAGGSAYVRRLVVTSLGTFAWWVSAMDHPNTLMAMRSRGGSYMRNNRPDFYLERVGEVGAEFRVFTGDRRPLNHAGLLSECGDMYRDIHEGRLVLYGDHTDLRVIEQSIGDVNRGGQLRWQLGHDRRGDTEFFRPPFKPPHG